MPDSTHTDSIGGLLPDNEAIAFFEQILVSMPDDRTSIEVLSQAYEGNGETEKARDLLIRLARVVERDGDADAARLLQPRLAAYAGQAETDAALQQLDAFLGGSSAGESPETSPVAARGATAPAAAAPAAGNLSLAMQHVQGAMDRRAIVTQELDFAWMLHEQGILSEDQYASVVSDITDLSASATPLPISVLHLFQDRQIPNIDRVLTFAAEKSGAPLLPLSSFDPQAAAYQLLPLEYLIIKGVIPFEMISKDLLVAALNPLNTSLKEEVEKLTGRRCHFYLVQPSEFDTAIDRIRKQQLPAGSSGK
jgi:hypothetical protein